MNIGVPKEIKNNEFRVSATPSGVHAYVVAGHKVLVEAGAGLGSAGAAVGGHRLGFAAGAEAGAVEAAAEHFAGPRGVRNLGGAGYDFAQVAPFHPVQIGRAHV